ncbi:MAG: GntR family transcriptional regulator [Anaerolineales bacterium]|nr:GntR family transcriptional regulator [Anaerolineales bacterium]
MTDQILHKLQLNPDSDISLIAQLTRQITWLISSGELQAGELLPSMRDLANQLEVHMHTVRQAYQRLEADHLVSIRTRRGTEVLPYNPEALAAISGDTTSHLVGIILPNPVPFYTPYIQRIQNAARDLGYFPLFCYTFDNSFLAETFFNQLLTRQVDGFIITSLSLPSLVENPALREKYPPIVSVDMPDMPGYKVLLDLENAGYQAAAHLLSHGYRRLGLITPPLEWPNLTPYYQGYQKALAEYNLKPEPELIRIVQGFLEPFGQEGAEELLDLAQPPQAILCAADPLALGAMTAIRERGLSIPGDIALAGSNDIPSASLVNPALTTVSMPAAEMGSRAFNMLEKLLSGKKPPQEQIILPTELVIRRSCGCQ